MERLNSEELSFFKTYGYLIKRRALDTRLCQRALERMWQTAPGSVKRDDPETWGPIGAQDTSDDALLVKQGTRWQLRSASTERDLIDLMYSEQITAWAEQLLGQGSLRPPTVGGKPMGSWGPAWPGGPVDPQLGEGIRGIYATLPTDADPTALEDHMHTDGHPFHLGIVGLIDDCPVDGGAFKVWPGSHQRFYPLFPMQYDQARIPYYDHMPTHKGIIHPPAYLAEVEQVEADTTPVDCYGQCGDVVFWHHRLGHMAGHNTASPKVIRQAVLADFCKADLDELRTTSPQEDMWHDWSDELKQANQPVSAQFAAEQRLPLDLFS